MVVENTPPSVNFFFLNSLIYRITHEFIRIMASKGQIHGELGIFFRYIQNLIKLDSELGREIREIDIFR